MNTSLFRTRILLPSVMVLLTVLVLGAMAGTAFGVAGVLRTPITPAAEVPSLMSYQGSVKVGNSPYSGVGYFKFAVVDAPNGDGSTNYWANDGSASGEPAAALTVTVNGGLFTVMLGDTSLGGMTQPITKDAFSATITYLRVWFGQAADGPFQALEPNQHIGSVAYALRAAQADSASDAEQLGGVGANSYLQKDSTATVASLVATGPVTIGSTDTCGVAGTVRWTGTALEVCNGLSWAPLSTTAQPQIAFRAVKTRTVSDIAVNSWYTATFDVETFDDGDGFSDSTFTAPNTGVYHLDCRVELTVYDYGGSFVWAGVAIFADGVAIAESVENSITQGRLTRQISLTVNAEQGTAFTCRTNKYGASYALNGQTIDEPAVTEFSGYQIY
jgi:hypothetical protein